MKSHSCECISAKYKLLQKLSITKLFPTPLHMCENHRTIIIIISFYPLPD
jgi:hypothetical protein